MHDDMHDWPRGEGEGIRFRIPKQKQNSSEQGEAGEEGKEICPATTKQLDVQQFQNLGLSLPIMSFVCWKREAKGRGRWWG